MALFSILVFTPNWVFSQTTSDLLVVDDAPPAGTTIQLIQTNETNLQFSLTLDGLDHKENTLQATGLTHYIAEPGAPALPYYSTLIALPPQAEVSIAIQENGLNQLPLTTPLQPLPQTVGEADLTTGDIGPLDHIPNPDIYQTNALYPSTSFRISEPMYSRDIRVVRLDLYPARYNPVTNLVTYTDQLDISLTFTGANWTNLRPAPSGNDAHFQTLGDSILNKEQAQEWRSLPAGTNTNETVLPIGQDTFKIKVNQDGIYEITYADLQAAGMAVGTVNPNTFEMNHRGQPIAYQFIGDTDNNFEAGEAIHFYGWRYDGSRLERQFLADNENYYWLWAGGTATRINTLTNPAGHPLSPSFPHSVTYEEELLFTFTRTGSWDTFPNEGDAWYSDGIRKQPSTADSKELYDVTLIDPAPTGADAQLTSEVTVRQNDLWTHNIETYHNDHPQFSDDYTWIGRQNVNITATIPITTLVNGNNKIALNIRTSNNDTQAIYYLNRITVDYLRQFIAVDNQLVFDSTTGPHTFTISNFSLNNSNQVAVWDITDRLIPQAIPMTAGNISGSNPYNYTFGTNQSNGSFVATNDNGLQSPMAITKYVPTSLNPAGNIADWLAISHNNFIAPANTLANHRQNPLFGGHTTHVIDIADVIEQYGYGYHTPAGIQAYLSYALTNWPQAPTYVTLIGDATSNPRGLPCAITGFGADCLEWSLTPETNFVPVDILFIDRYSGWVVTDYTNVLLAGNDDLPDMTIGRLPAQTATEASNIINKIITYEQNHLNAQQWQENLIFVADDADVAGDFCAGNASMSAFIPDNFNETHLCYDDYDNVIDIREDIGELVVDGEGVTFFNYRGHGGVDDWADEGILTVDSLDFWDPQVGDVGKPVVILSLDCLDGDFSRQGQPALSESFLKLDSQGSLAHLSSTGLGLDWEHTQLQSAFYTALFQNNITTIGGAMDYAKINYVGYFSEIYTLTLQGDPAMYMMRTELDVQKSALQPTGQPGQPVSYNLDIVNNGIYPSSVVMTDTLPAGLTLQSIASTTPIITSVSGNDIIIEFQQDLTINQSAQVTLEALIDNGYTGTTITNNVFAFGTGAEGDLSNNSDTVTIPIAPIFKIRLPILSRN